jgi:hypothetical protein
MDEKRLLIKSSRYELGVRSFIGTKLTVLRESLIDAPPVEGLVPGDSGGLGLMALAVISGPDGERIFETRSPPPPIVVIPVPPPGAAVPAL